MLCLEVLLDGKVICRAGDKELSLLTATLHLLPEIKMQRLIVAGSLERETHAKVQRWLDMSLLMESTLSFRVVQADVVDAPTVVSHFGTLPGEEHKSYFCSFCGASGSDGTPLMTGHSANICSHCVTNFFSWAKEHSSNG
jgi:hypothetical protein